MCLDTISKRKPMESGFFYKGFSRVKKESAGGFCTEGTYSRGVWLTANEQQIRMGGLLRHLQYYTSGFHGFEKNDRKRIAEIWGGLAEGEDILPCQYRGGHTLGTQDGLPVIVAREMRILLPGEKVPKPRKRLSSRKG